MGRSANYSRENCPAAACLEVVGEPWTLLIVRDALSGKTRFEQWQDGLGLARNVLASRLKTLTLHGIFEANLYCERPPRYEYLLTEKGRELAPLILHMAQWGRRHVYADASPGSEYIHNSCGQKLKPGVYCTTCNGPVGNDDFTR
ncbi:MAG: winged helix-turn-helix transcriptional regulator, partial [Asticcacaulis sp.]